MDLYTLQEDNGDYLTLDKVIDELSSFSEEEKNSVKDVKAYDIIFCYQIILGGPNNGKYKRRHAIVTNPKSKSWRNAMDFIPITSSYNSNLHTLYEQHKIKIKDRKNANLSTNKDLYMNLDTLYNNIIYGKPLRYVKKEFIAKKVGTLQKEDFKQLLMYQTIWDAQKKGK